MQLSAQISCQIFGSSKVFLALIVFSFQGTDRCSSSHITVQYKKMMVVLKTNMLQTDSPNFYFHISSHPVFASEVSSTVSYVLFKSPQIDFFSTLHNPVLEEFKLPSVQLLISYREKGIIFFE